MGRLKAVADNWYSFHRPDTHQYNHRWSVRDGDVGGPDCQTQLSWLLQAAFTTNVCLGRAYCYRSKLVENARKVYFHACKHFSMPGTILNAEALIAGAQPFFTRRALPIMAPFLPGQDKFCRKCGHALAGAH